MSNAPETAPEPSPEFTISRLRRRLWLERGFFTCVILAAGATWSYPRLFPDAWAVYVAGRPVAATRSRSALQAALRRVESGYPDNPQASILASQARIRRVDPHRVPLTDLATAEQALESEWQARVAQAVIYVDGNAVVALPDQAQAQTVLDRVKSALTGTAEELEAAPTFKEKVEIRMEPAADEIKADVDTAVALLKGEGAENEGTHEVVDGESAWSIARRYELSVAELKRYNPGIRLDRIHTGDRLVVSDAASPPVTVLAEAKRNRDVLVDFPTQIRQSPQMFLGKRVLLQAGKPGKGRALYRVRLENGKPVSEEIVERQVLSPATPKIVVLGSRARR